MKTLVISLFFSVLVLTQCIGQKKDDKLPLNYNANLQAYRIPVAKKAAKSTVKEKLSGLKLNEGQQLSFEFLVNKNHQRVGESRSCVADAGFIIDGCSFIIQNNKKDLRIFAGYGGLEKAPYYVLNRFAEDIKVKCYITKTSNGFEWAVEAPIGTYGGKVSKKVDSKKGLKFSYTPVRNKDLAYYITAPERKKASLPKYEAAILHPLIKYESTAIDKYDWNEPAAKYLVLDDTEHLSQKELNGLKNYLLNYQLPKHNHMNYYFRKRMNSYMMEWLYQKEADEKLLIKAIQVAECAIAYRNDNFGKYPLSYSKTVAPLWPNFKEIEVYKDGKVGLVPGASAFAGLASITVPIRMIANQPGLWEKTYNGLNYYEIAQKLIKEAFKTIDYTYDVFVGEDNLLRYPETLMREEWHGKVFIYNRVFPVLSGSIPLIEALETFELYPEKAQKMDAVNQAMLNYLQSDMSYFGKNNSYLKYPYSQAAQDKNPDVDQVEDFMHGSFDSRDFQLFYKSGRYNFSKEIIKAMANTLVEKVAVGDGTFSERMNGSAKARKYTTPIAYDGFIWYAGYRPEVKKLIINHIIDNNIAIQNGVWDAYCLYEILKLKDHE
ncbi:MAG: hypothetical protein N4A71_15095 [Carboxylicivirga sp.]|jgi:hypothetical protein|nr:hypothetical protein [Carboxylicivirga sp.]